MSTTEENKAIVRRYFEEIANQNDLAVVTEIIAPEHVADIVRLVTALRTAFPDFHITIDDQIAEEDRVATSFTAQGTHDGEWHSPIGMIPPTGKQFKHQGIRVFRLAAGKLVDTWGGADTLTQLQQLGVTLMLPLSSAG